MKKLAVFILALVSITLLNSCAKFGEVNLSKATVTILAPGNHDSLSGSNVTFWWQPVTGATKYNIEIVKPSFSNVQKLFIDSNVTTNKFIFSLNPGSYEWRVQAINNSSQSAYFTQSFFLDSNLNLATSTVILSSPANGYVTSSFSVNLQWLGLSAANSYNLTVEKTGSNPATITGITSPSYNYVFPSYGTYKWQVSAINSTSNSQPSVWNTLTVSIPCPTSQSPNNKDTTQIPPVILSWSRGSFALNQSTSAYDSLYVYADTTGTSITTQVISSTKTYSFNPTSPPPKQWYSWKVKTIDSLGDQSVFTALRKFRLKQ